LPWLAVSFHFLAKEGKVQNFFAGFLPGTAWIEEDISFKEANSI
jgi:hypothetical protein